MTRETRNDGEEQLEMAGTAPTPLSQVDSTTLAPDWHPLAHIDAFILACGWTHELEGFVPPESWREAIALQHGRGLHWKREHAVQFCVRYYELRENANGNH